MKRISYVTDTSTGNPIYVGIGTNTDGSFRRAKSIRDHETCAQLELENIGIRIVAQNLSTQAAKTLESILILEYRKTYHLLNKHLMRHAHTGFEQCFKVPYTTSNISGWMQWNPLVDDGDAFRLMIKLNLDFYICDDDGPAAYLGFFRKSGFRQRFAVERHDNMYVATRRAIVRAAAEIGKKL